jgi:glutamyl/glutaminyl-tRNA synthetase
LSAERKKLSKRDGDVSVEDYINKGYLKEAIINFVALLGWNPGKGETQEIFTLDELVQKFDLANVNKAGAVFDVQKLNWINSQYIKKLSVDELYTLTKKYFKADKPEEFWKKVLAIEQERLTNLSGAGESNKFFFENINYDKELLRWKKMTNEEIKNNLEKAKNILENITDANWTRENLEKVLLEAAGDKKGEFLWPLRAALTGERKSPPPHEVTWVLGQKESINRLDQAIDKINNHQKSEE